ncbi:hypothetical protein GC176_13325 [bacterium]|nr:hypothetical protein [bacterium]
MTTPISLPYELEIQLKNEATACGMTLDEFVQTTLEWAIAHRMSDDPLFADRAVFRDRVSEEFADSHDDILYGEGS